jgi:Fur family peroxide stress response transcriptional regulator
MNFAEFKQILTQHGLKVTPQRLAVLNALSILRIHPTAEHIIEYIRANNPAISLGTVYNVLDVFVAKNICKKVLTDNGIIRYDFQTEKHHHLYCAESNRIVDYYDHELDRLIENYFSDKKIPDFNIEDIKLQITGRFISSL